MPSARETEHAPVRDTSVAQLLKRAGLLAGPLAGALCYVLLPEQYAAPDGTSVAFAHSARATLAIMCWMAIWWMTEAIAIEATAL